MNNDQKPLTETLDKLKTGAFERRWMLAKAGVLAGSRYAAGAAKSLFLSKDQRQAALSDQLSRQAQFLIKEMGKLKGSVVKIGQLMALWGEHCLPKEVTQALHQLEDKTAHLPWELVRSSLVAELGSDILSVFEFDPKPIGAASFGQVHLAKRKKDGLLLCFKIQYPHVADSIDSDLMTMMQLMRLARIVPASRDFEDWVYGLRDLLHSEIDYELEAKATQRFYERLQHDTRYVVPRVYFEYSSKRVLATRYEQGVGVNSETVKSLSAFRRNRLAEICLDLFWREVFVWGEMQTDPNFGNYFVRLDPEAHQDKLILLDFGAVHVFDSKVLLCGRQLIDSICAQEFEQTCVALRHLNFLHDDVPASVYQDIYALCTLALEPFLSGSNLYQDNQGRYHWSEANLMNRVLKFASRKALSKHFHVPPKEVMFITRKIMGAYTLMVLLQAQLDGTALIQPYLDQLKSQFK